MKSLDNINTMNNRLKNILIAIPALLIIPLIANLFTDGEGWSFFDFIVMGALFFVTGLLCELIMRKIKRFEYRILVCAFVLGGLLVVWLELAVGYIGTAFSGS